MPETFNLFKAKRNNVCFIGDIHGEFNALQGLMKHTEFEDTEYIVCGDCGFGFNKSQYYNNVINKLNKTASKYNCEFLFVRGNHDDKSYFDERKINKELFKTLPDYTVVQTEMHNILCVGGGVSIDRTRRIVNTRERALKYLIHHMCSIDTAMDRVSKEYWEDEMPVYDEIALDGIKSQGIEIDIVCSHTCPTFVVSAIKDGIREWIDADSRLENDIINERETMDKVYEKLKNDGHQLKKWFYGHFHYHNSEFINGTHFVMLDMFRNGRFDIYDLR